MTLRFAIYAVRFIVLVLRFNCSWPRLTCQRKKGSPSLGLRMSRCYQFFILPEVKACSGQRTYQPVCLAADRAIAHGVNHRFLSAEDR